MSRRPRLVLGALLLAAYAYFPDAAIDNVEARYAQTVCIVAHGTLSIDRYVPLTVDWARRDGVHYPNKPPGMSFLAVPPYAALYHLERACGVDPLDPRGAAWRVNLALLTLLLVALPVACAAGTLMGLLARWGASERAAGLAALAWGLATLTFPYATALMPHALAAAIFVAAFDIVSDPASSRVRLAVAGLLCGAAVLCDYVGALGAAAVGIHALLVRRPARDLAVLALAALPPIVALVAYQAAVFGHPLAPTYAFNNPLMIARDETGMAGQLTAPTPLRVIALLFGPRRGLFIYMPILLTAAVGLAALWRDGRRPLVALIAGLTAAHLLVNATWWQDHGGHVTGPRFLLPVVPFLMLGVAVAMPRYPRLTLALGLLSFLNAFCITAVTIQTSAYLPSPLILPLYPALVTGDLESPNLGRLVGLGGHLSLIPWFAITVPLARAFVRALPTSEAP